MRKNCLVIILPVLLLQASLSAQTPLIPRDTTIVGPQTFAMVVGISDYRYVRPLNYADKDAELFSDFLRSPGGGNVPKDNIFSLLNEKATSSNFWSKGFQWMKEKRLQKGDKLFIYMAGHGDAIDEDQYFFISYDCNPGGDKNNYLAGGTIQLFNLKKKIAAETAKGVEVIFIMDACRTNELPGGAEGLNFLNTAISEKKAGEIIMLATGAGQESLEDASIGNGHGLFTWYLVDGLSGMADMSQSADRKVTYHEIQTYVDSNVPAIAQQQFRRNQEPFFCCNESSEKVISTVDTAYLRKWMDQKNQSHGGNSFRSKRTNSPSYFTADTLLVETYNKFYDAVNNKNLNGPSSAEDFLNQLNKKYPGNPYTLDAKSTLAIEYINAAQAKMNQYFSCFDDPSTAEKKRNTELGTNLEKAINLIREDEPEYAEALIPQMLFWKASGETENAFQYAYQALAAQPNGAFIYNRLALLHLDNNNKDSALYYAEKATQLAPKWTCAFGVLNKVKESKPNKNNQLLKKDKRGIGFTAGGGTNNSNPTYSGNRNGGIIDVESNSAGAFGAGINYTLPLGRTVSIRPEAVFNYSNTSIDFLSGDTTGGQPAERTTVPFKINSAHITLPFIFNFTSDKKANPYFKVAASIDLVLSQDNASSRIIPVNKSLAFGDAAFGVDLHIPKTMLVLSPEIKYSMGLSNMNSTSATSNFARALSGLKRNALTLNLYLSLR